MAITIHPIELSDTDTFFSHHFTYLVEDEIVTDEEDLEYFRSEEYRGAILRNMEERNPPHVMLYFVEDGKEVGAAQYNIFPEENDICLLMDFWVFPRFRGNGMGHRCFNTLLEKIKDEGAASILINAEKEEAVRFWKSLGFKYAGEDEYGDPTYTLSLE